MYLWGHSVYGGEITLQEETEAASQHPFVSRAGQKVVRKWSEKEKRSENRTLHGCADFANVKLCVHCTMLKTFWKQLGVILSKNSSPENIFQKTCKGNSNILRNQPCPMYCKVWQYILICCNTLRCIIKICSVWCALHIVHIVNCTCTTCRLSCFILGTWCTYYRVWRLAGGWMLARFVGKTGHVFWITFSGFLFSCSITNNHN